MSLTRILARPGLALAASLLLAGSDVREMVRKQKEERAITDQGER